jgi:MerR family copper efflux transcriptional regulator
MIRHYESVGLVQAAARTESGYRQYGPADVHTLRFIRHARDLGFSIAEIGELVGLWNDRNRPSRQVKVLAERHILELDRKARDLLAMKATLEHLTHCCHGDDRPECPILETLANGSLDAEGPARHIAHAAHAAPAAPSPGKPRARKAST